MAFQEKSAWLMSIALILGGLFYYNAVSALTTEIGALAPPILPTIVVYTFILVIIAVIGHVAIAVFAPKEANAPLDERDKTILNRAGHLSGYVLGIGVIMALGHYLFLHNGDILFYGVFASLMLSQLAEYLIQIFYYRAVV